ncbi:MAG: SPFH domain-containing protein [Clostridia bacterium]|nr:SPFH domain-containing protein [Clostridia bacterium]
MGLIKSALESVLGAAGQSISSTMGDQFLTVIKCDDMGNDLLMKKITDDNGALAKGSRIIVAPGQVAVIYDSGKILDATAEPGTYQFDQSTTPSFFAGQFGAVFKEMWERFKFGGAVAKEQAIFFFNVKEIVGNKFGTPNPVPYRDWGHALLNARTGGFTPMMVDIKCFGTYTFRINNPAQFMMQMAGSAKEYRKDALVEQMRSEVVGAFQNILNSLSEPEHKIEALALPNKTDEIKNIMSEQNFDGAIQNRGVGLVSFVVESVTLTEESKENIRKYELAGDQFQQQGTLTQAYANAIQDAAKNENGAMNGFVGMGMMNMQAGNVFGATTAAVANNVNYPNPNQQAAAQASQPVGAVVAAPAADAWKCPKCGTENTGKFCMECGEAKPVAAAGVKCPKCGKEWPAGTKFCGDCGEKLGE